MSLIDADALMSAVMAQDVVDKSVAKRLILQAPTVDALPVMTYPQVDGLTPTVVATPNMVQVVRCGQCSHSEVCKMDEGDVRYCHIFEMQTEDDYYCADGERKDDA